MTRQEFLNDTRKMFPTTIDAYFTQGSFGMFCATLKSKVEANKLAKLWTKATKKTSEIEEVYNEKDVFNRRGELVDVLRLDLKGYKVVNVFKN